MAATSLLPVARARWCRLLSAAAAGATTISISCSITAGQAAAAYLPILVAGDTVVGLPLLSVVEVELPVDTSVVRLFASPWNGQEATFLLRCSYPFAAFNYSTSSASPTAYSPAHAMGNVSTENGELQVQVNLNGWPDGSYVTVAACSRQGDGKRDASPSEVGGSLITPLLPPALAPTRPPWWPLPMLRSCSAALRPTATARTSTGLMPLSSGRR